MPDPSQVLSDIDDPARSPWCVNVLSAARRISLLPPPYRTTVIEDSEKNGFDVEKYLRMRCRVNKNEAYECYEYSEDVG